MFISRTLFLVFSFWILQCIADETGPDYEREQRIAQQIEPQIFDGDAVWLNDGNRDFLSIHMEADQPKGSVLILHGRDVNPEDQNVVGPVRVHLAENGWTTLAIQMPVLEKGKTYNDYLPILKYAHPRIEAAIDYLRQNGEDTIIIASHSCGAHMTHNWINTSDQQDIQGYIAIGVGATDAGQKLQTPFPFADMTVPVLDIYGTDEFPGPLSMVDDRLGLLKQNGHPDSAQIAVDGADHYFHDMGEQLAQQLLSWLDETNF